MAIKGSLKEASLPDVLQLLALGQKTGCLSIADRSNFGYIYFDKGRICYASIVNRRDRLGDILVKHEKITSEHLDAAIHRQSKEHGKKLGEILVGMGVITQADLERYMRVQIEESVFYLFTWTQGTFNFEADIRPERQDFLVSINPESLLLEGARRVDEWSLIEKKIPSFDLIFVVDKDRLAISEGKLTDTQERILPLLDGSRGVSRPSTRRSPTRASRSTAISGSPSTRPACWTKRRASSGAWPSCGPARPMRTFTWGSWRCARRAGAKRWKRCGSRRRRVAGGRRCSTTWGSPTSSWGDSTRRRRRTARRRPAPRPIPKSISAGASWP
ncbi:MAG: hypothetical protein AUH07_06600 [Gemmatimonadetes bacterium 13_2_20CM_70_9]|nr:MAG: hypothetical protein AUH07_06600 [Gemmatimonadetes bacterium 13_2_20CM_70_9]